MTSLFRSFRPARIRSAMSAARKALHLLLTSALARWLRRPGACREFGEDRDPLPGLGRAGDVHRACRGPRLSGAAQAQMGRQHHQRAAGHPDRGHGRHRCRRCLLWRDPQADRGQGPDQGGGRLLRVRRQHLLRLLCEGRQPDQDRTRPDRQEGGGQYAGRASGVRAARIPRAQRPHLCRRQAGDIGGNPAGERRAGSAPGARRSKRAQRRPARQGPRTRRYSFAVQRHRPVRPVHRRRLCAAAEIHSGQSECLPKTDRRNLASNSLGPDDPAGRGASQVRQDYCRAQAQRGCVIDQVLEEHRCCGQGRRDQPMARSRYGSTGWKRTVCSSRARSRPATSTPTSSISIVRARRRKRDELRSRSASSRSARNLSFAATEAGRRIASRRWRISRSTCGQASSWPSSARAAAASRRCSICSAA